MRTQNIQSPQFKGRYLLMGQEGVLDEVCWYLQRKQKKSDGEFGFVDFRNGLFTPLGKKSGVNADLFLTGQDREFIEPKLDSITTETFEPYLRKLPILVRLRKALENLQEVRGRLERGVPIEGLDSKILSSYLEQHIDVPSLSRNITPAAQAFEAIKKGSFDIVEGTLH